MNRRHGMAVTLAAVGLWCAAALPAHAGKPGAIYWAVRADGEGEPFQVTGDQAGRTFPDPLVLWSGDRGMVLWGSGKGLPKEIPEGRAVDVTVRDGQGSRVTGVAMEYKPSDGPNLPEPFGRITTDGGGRARLFIHPGQVLLLWIASPRFLPQAVTVDGSVPLLEMKALPAPLGSFRVEGPFGRALAGASGLFLPSEAPRNPLLLAKERKSAARRGVSDAQGFLRLEGAGAGRPFLLWAQGYALREVAGAPDYAVLALERAGSLALRLRMPEGLPPAWKVEVRHQAEGLPWLVVTEEWTFAGPRGKIYPPAYPCEVRLRAEGCAEEVLSFARPPAQEVVVSLSRGVLLAGTVRGEEGRKIAGAMVYLGTARRPPFVVTDAEGRFAFPLQRPEEAPWDLLVSADGYLEAQFSGVVPEQAGRCEIVLSRGGGLFGRVELQGEGTPPPVFRVRVAALSRISSQGASFDAETHEDGTFEATGLEEGTYQVQASSKGLRSPAISVEVKAGVLSDAGTLVLGRKPSVRGRLAIRGEGTPDAREAEIRLRRQMGPPEAATGAEAVAEADERNEDGTFAFWGVPPGNYRLEARFHELAARSGELRVGEEDVDAGTLSLEPEAFLRGRLLSRALRDFSGYRILLQNGVMDFDGPSASAASDGTFSLGPLSPGRYTLAVFAPFSVIPKVRRVVEVAAGSDSGEIAVPLEGLDVVVQAQVDGHPASSGSLSFEAAHEEASGAPLAIETPEGMLVLGFPAPLVHAQTDGGGFALLRDCPAGSGTATLSWNGGEWALPVTIPDRPTENLVWNFHGLTLQGQVLDEGGEAVPLALVSWAYEERGMTSGAEARAEGEGRFVFSGLAAGRLRLRAVHPEKGEGETSVVLPSPSPASVVIRLHRGGP